MSATPVDPEAYIIDDDDVIVLVDRIPSLAINERPAVLLPARVIVVRADVTDFRAFSVVCPHAGCAVSNVDGPRLICPCHLSEFDSRGNRLAGPAPTGLTTLNTVFDAAAGILRVRREPA